MNTDAITDELDVIMTDFFQRTQRPPDSAERPATPRLQVDVVTVQTKSEAKPFGVTVPLRTINSNANPNNSIRG